MLPAQNRMTRSSDFDATVRDGARAVQTDLVVYARRGETASAAKVGLIIAKSVGSAVQRHRVARRLRHIARAVLPDLDPCDQVVIRALPGSQAAISNRLEQQLRAGLQRTGQSAGRAR
ncbi:ribonuclease P protein component [Mycobacterium sp.]|uniref:ribonuclease P protein component n=1 Tax=Mycobacterium sp. TaxID=1785 RepID=UPI003D6BCE2C